jgi:hypothetical protein
MSSSFFIVVLPDRFICPFGKVRKSAGVRASQNKKGWGRVVARLPAWQGVYAMSVGFSGFPEIRLYFPAKGGRVCAFKYCEVQLPKLLFLVRKTDSDNEGEEENAFFLKCSSLDLLIVGVFHLYRTKQGKTGTIPAKNKQNRVKIN